MALGCERPEPLTAESGWRAASAVLLERVTAAAEPGPDSEPDPDAVLTHRDAPPHERSSPLSRRASVRDSVLHPFRKLVSSHFDETARSSLRLQSVDLAGGRRSLLLQSTADSQRPLIVTTEPSGVLSWTKERPLAGMVDGIEHLSVLPGPEGGIALFLVAPSQQTVGARMWAGDGGIISDFHLLSIEGVTDLAALYAPGSGWIVAASNEAGVRMQRLDEKGRIELERSGGAIGAKTISSEAIALARDGDASFMLLQLGPPKNAPGAQTKRHLYASRFDMRGERRWPRPVEIGTTPSGGAAPILQASVSDGLVRVELKSEGRSLLRAWVSSDGSFEREGASGR